ncbi:MAG: terminase large subunit domain-containing protein [Bacillota bacterium]
MNVQYSHASFFSPAKAFFWASGKKPYKYQIDFLEKVYQNSRVVVVKSRRIGITYAAAVFSFVMAVIYGKKILSIFPSLRQTIKFMEYIEVMWLNTNANVEFEKGFEVRNTKTELAFSNGGEIIALPNNPETVRGFGADWVIIDEAAHFQNINEIWNSVLPSISRGGNIVLISTPRGASGLFYEKYNSDDYEKLNIQWMDCPDFENKVIEEIKSDLPEDIFQQEYSCCFLQDEDSYFPFSLTTPCIGETENLRVEYSDKYSISYGIDIGRKRDLTAIIGVMRIDCVNEKDCINKLLRKDKESESKFYVVHNEVLKKTEYEKQLAYISSLIEKTSPKQVLIDQTGIGSMMAEILLKKYGNGRITPITFTMGNKNDMMVWLRKSFENRDIIIPNDDNLLNSLRSIKRENTATGIKYDINRNDSIGHADESIALAMALYSFKKKSEPRFLEMDVNVVA